MDEIPACDAGTASALFSCARQMGGVVGVALFGALFATAAETSARSALTPICLLGVSLTLLWLALGRRYLPR